MVYNEKIDQLVTEINNLNSIFSKNQNDFFIELDSLKVLQNNIKTLSVNLKNSNFIENEIKKLYDLVFNYTIELSGNNIEYIEVFSLYNDPGVIALDESGNSLNVEISFNNVNTNIIGNYSIIYNVIVNDKIFTSLTRIIIVQDTTSPVITINGENPLTLEVYSEFIDPGANAYDAYFGDLTNSITITSDLCMNILGRYNITYTCVDPCGNITNDTRIIFVVDTTSPTIQILGNNPLTLEVFSDLSGIELGAIAYDNYDNILDISSISNLDISNVGTYNIIYYVIDNCGNDASATRIIHIVDTTAPEISLIGENPLIWNINVPYVDPGINLSDNYDMSLNPIVTNLVNIYETGIYSYKYTVIDNNNNKSELTRVVYVLDYTVLENIPIINISEDSSQNIVNILKFSENTNFFTNNELSMKDNFLIHFENKNINYNIPLELLKNSFTNYYKMNNMIIFVYGFKNENIHIIENSNNLVSEYPYITDKFDVKSLVNLFINNNEKYKMLILNGKESNLLEHRKPVLTLSGDNPYNLLINNNFIEPGYNASDYKGNDISVNIYDNINTNLIGNYNVLYVATDNSGNQNIQNRKVNIVNNIEIN